MNTIVKGRAFVFGDNISTDEIYPGQFLDLTDPQDVGKHAMQGSDPNFVSQFKTGDVIVAASNFGCGSSREHAVVTLKAIGVGVVIAESFGRIFYRNAINLGIPLIVCLGISQAVRNGDVISVDIAKGVIKNETTHSSAKAEPLSAYVMEILSHDGIKPMVKKQMESASE